MDISQKLDEQADRHEGYARTLRAMQAYGERIAKVMFKLNLTPLCSSDPADWDGYRIELVTYFGAYRADASLNLSIRVANADYDLVTRTCAESLASGWDGDYEEMYSDFGWISVVRLPLVCDSCDKLAEYANDSHEARCKECMTSDLRYGWTQCANPGEDWPTWLAEGLEDARVTS